MTSSSQRSERMSNAAPSLDDLGIVLPTMRDVYVGQMLNVLHRAVASLELEVGGLPAQAFGPGAVYDFNKALRELLGTATSSLFVIDPYIDDQIFDTYLGSVSSAVSVRLLTQKASPALKATVSAFVKQRKMSVEARLSKAIHDRVIFLDDRSCWVLGQSVKDAAKSKPTYLAPLPSDVVVLKKDDYVVPRDPWTVADLLRDNTEPMPGEPLRAARDAAAQHLRAWRPRTEGTCYPKRRTGKQ